MLCCMLDSIAQTGCSVACFFLHMHALMHVGGEDKCLTIDKAWGMTQCATVSENEEVLDMPKRDVAFHVLLRRRILIDASKEFIAK